MSKKSPMKLLLLEDSEDDATLILSQLSKAGLVVDARRVETELEYLRELKDSPDAVIADCSLPGFSGINALKLLRAQDSALPFLVVSGTIGEATAVEMMRAGASDYFLKSENLSRLAPALMREVKDAETKRAHQRIESKWRLAEQALSNAAEAIFITDKDLHLISVNRAFTDITGYSAEEVLGKLIPGLAGGIYPASFRDDMATAIEQEGRWQGQLVNHRKNGESYRELMSVSAIRDQGGQITHLVGAANDITVYKRYEEELDYLAHHDAVTGLANRRSLEKQFERARTHTRRDGPFMAVLFMDMDNFKSINDTLGHLAGDELLKTIAMRLFKCVRKDDTVARLGGDEFVILVPGLTSIEAAYILPPKLTESLRQPVMIQGREVYTSVSVGVSIFPHDGTSLDGLLLCADNAMYQAKKQGRNTTVFYDSRLNAETRNYFDIVNALHHAIEHQEFQLHYQPCVDMSTGEVHSLEALIRWDRPGHGDIPPGLFIPIAEKCGLIIPISEWVLDMACGQAAAWHAAGIRFGRVGVNLSAYQFTRAGTVEQIKKTLSRHGLAPQSLILEVTESMLMEDPLAAGAMLNDLHELGIAIAIDDFGTGYSSLAYLKQFPFDLLKIDGTFIEGLPNDENDVAITDTVISMAQSLRLGVIAECVETDAQKTFLLAHNCLLSQGFLFARPMPATEVESMLCHADPLRVA